MTPKRSQELILELIDLAVAQKNTRHPHIYQTGYLIGFLSQLAADDSLVAEQLLTRVAHLRDSAGRTK